jgi:hypothetical protein
VKKRDGRKKTGRSATITPRDDAIMLALFLCRYLSTAELAILFFNSKSAARRRLAELVNKGYLEPRSLYATMPTWDRRGKRENVWHLTKQGFEMVAESLGLDDERYVPKQLGQEGAIHHVKTAEVYVAAKADLDEILGPYPAWSWEHEKRAQDSYRYSGRLMGHQPDAHVRFADHLFVVERQTRESRVGPKAIDDKVSSHATYARVRLDEPDKMDVLFACDDKRVAELAERAGKRYGVDVIAGSVEHVAYYLYQSALRLAPEAGKTVHTYS